MQLAHSEVVITPTQGFLGGIGLSLAANLLLFFTGRVFGISGFIHRSFRPSSTSSTTGRRGDILGVTGLVLGGLCVGILESLHPEKAGGVEAEGGTDSILPDSAFSGLATFALAGLLSGIGSKLQNGCTSGHMICGISRFSRRSFIATAAFFGVASITTQLHRQTLHSVKGYDWTLGSTGLSILQTQGALFGALIILLIIFSRTNIERSSGRYRGLFDGSITLLSAIVFALALRLSTLNSPAKVISFLVTPIPDPQVFDPTLAFLALGALPLAIVLYQLGNRLHTRPEALTSPVREDVKVQNTGLENVQREPLLTLEQPRSPVRRLPILGNDTWPDGLNQTIDARLIGGAVIFGVGWGILGLCPGPALVNFGISLYALGRGKIEDDLLRGGIWLATFVVGGLVVS